MDPMFALMIVISVAGLSVALSLNMVAEAIKRVARAISAHGAGMDTMSDILRIRADAMIEHLKENREDW